VPRFVWHRRVRFGPNIRRWRDSDSRTPFPALALLRNTCQQVRCDALNETRAKTRAQRGGSRRERQEKENAPSDRTNGASSGEIESELSYTDAKYGARPRSREPRVAGNTRTNFEKILYFQAVIRRGRDVSRCKTQGSTCRPRRWSKSRTRSDSRDPGHLRLLGPGSDQVVST
jgi:hypothetical protein